MGDLRYPIGRFEAPDPITADHIDEWISDIGIHSWRGGHHLAHIDLALNAKRDDKEI